jgi:hypothetical protein
MEDDARTPRYRETREKESRTETQWVPPSLLPDPDPQEGWVFRWVRTSIMGHADNTNVSKMFRGGWVPCRAEDHPELCIQSDVGSRFGSDGNIEVGGLLLCKMPQEKHQQRAQFYRDKAEQQMDAVESNYMRENDPRMPLLKSERKTRVDFGKGG